jgi:hypothetical protein
MVTLMSWRSSGGKGGRCDGRCHAAKCMDCKCMCGGRFHGAVVDNTLQERIEQFGDEVLASAEQRAREQGIELEMLNKDELLKALREKRAWRRRDKEKTLKVSPQEIGEPLWEGIEISDQ